MDDRSAGAADRGSHRIEMVGLINDLWLSGGIDDGRLPFGDGPGQHQILGGTNRRERQLNLGSAETVVRFSLQHPVDEPKFSPHLAKAVEMHVDGTGAEVIATRKGNLCLSAGREQWTQ